MKLVMTLLVRDEADILRENIEFHLAQGVSFIIATDNCSVDGSCEILKEYEARGLLHYIYVADDNYMQHQWVTKMARLAFTKYSANWVINNDTDEFWFPHQGNLIKLFESLPSSANILQVRRKNFVMVDSSESLFYQRMCYQERNSDNALGEPLPDKVAHRGQKHIQVNMGNHSVVGFENMSNIRAAIDILHFPMRSCRQFTRKIRLGGAALQRNTVLPEGVGKTWRDLYAQYLKTGNLDNYCHQQNYDPEKLQKALEEGVIIKNTRLLEFFEGTSY